MKKNESILKAFCYNDEFFHALEESSGKTKLKGQSVEMS